MNKPECDYIKGIPPAIAIEQKVISRNPRSTVGTTTEIYEYLRLLFSRIGRTYSPISGVEVKKHTVEDVINCVAEFSPGTKFVVMSPLCLAQGRSVEQQLRMYVLQGYARMFCNGSFCRIEDFLDDGDAADADANGIYLVIDRLSVGFGKDDIALLVYSCPPCFVMIFLRVLRQTGWYSRSLRTTCFLSTRQWVLVQNARVLAMW